MTSKTVTVKIHRGESVCFIPVPFDPKALFGRVRAPVKVTLNGYTYRSTIASMRGTVAIPLRRSNREAAGLQGGETLSVKIELDSEARVVQLPVDVAKALDSTPGARDSWQALSYSHQREHIEAIEKAKKAETRTRRLESLIQALETP